MLTVVTGIPHLYFLPALFLLYLLFPFYFRLTKSHGKLALLLGIILMMIPLAGNYLTAEQYLTSWILNPISWSIYFILGIYWEQNNSIVNFTNEPKRRLFSYVLAVVSFILFILSLRYVNTDNQGLNAFIRYNLFRCFYSIALFIGLYSFFCKLHLTSLITTISSLTMTVYLVHPIIITSLMKLKFFKMDSMNHWKILLLWLIVVILAFTFAYCIHKILTLFSQRRRT